MKLLAESVVHGALTKFAKGFVAGGISGRDEAEKDAERVEEDESVADERLVHRDVMALRRRLKRILKFLRRRMYIDLILLPDCIRTGRLSEFCVQTSKV